MFIFSAIFFLLVKSIPKEGGREGGREGQREGGRSQRLTWEIIGQLGVEEKEGKDKSENMQHVSACDTKCTILYEHLYNYIYLYYYYKKMGKCTNDDNDDGIFKRL